MFMMLQRDKKYRVENRTSQQRLARAIGAFACIISHSIWRVVCTAISSLKPQSMDEFENLFISQF